MWLGSSGDQIKLVFSGDLGPRDVVVERMHTVVEEADYVIIESTYGDRNHKNLEDTRAEFRSGMERAIKTKGKILIPTFAVDRAQRLLYEIKRLSGDDSFPKTPPIFFDSPMGEKATQIYEKYLPILSRELQDVVREGSNPFAPEGLSYTSDAAASRAINNVGEAIVIAGSGMCSGGRIIHHLKHNLWKKNCNVFFVGYQAYGTLGRRLIEGEKNLRIAGEDIVVNATLHTLGGFSAHGDRDDLLAWTSHFKKSASFFVTHGELKSSKALSSGIREIGYDAVAPMRGSVYELEGRHASPELSVSSSKPLKFSDLEAVKALLADIASETESVRESLDSRKDYHALMPLLESSRLILQSVKNIK
jgi:metallo-beta-lactamase family protein